MVRKNRSETQTSLPFTARCTGLSVAIRGRVEGEQVASRVREDADPPVAEVDDVDAAVVSHPQTDRAKERERLPGYRVQVARRLDEVAPRRSQTRPGSRRFIRSSRRGS